MSEPGERVSGAILKHRAATESKRLDAIALASERDEHASAAVATLGGDSATAALATNGETN